MICFSHQLMSPSNGLFLSGIQMFYLELFKNGIFLHRQGIRAPLHDAVSKAGEQLAQYKATRARLSRMDTEELVWESEYA
jgi:hypothetical protein